MSDYTTHYRKHVHDIGIQLIKQDGFKRWDYNSGGASIQFFDYDDKLIGELEIWELIDLIINSCRDKNGR